MIDNQCFTKHITSRWSYADLSIYFFFASKHVDTGHCLPRWKALSSSVFFCFAAIRTFFCYLLQLFCSDSYPYIFLLSSSVFLFWLLSVHFSVYFFRFCVLTAFHTCFCLLVDTELWIHALVILYPVRSVTTVMSFKDMVVMLFGWSMLYQSPGPDSWSPWSTPADVVLLLVDFSSNKVCKYVCLLVSWDHM